jgi:hypothetical protein
MGEDAASESEIPSDKKGISHPHPAAEEPTIFELMMKEHEEAKKAKDEVAAQERAKESKSLGGGFKKGFFGGGDKDKENGKDKDKDKKKPASAPPPGTTASARSTSSSSSSASADNRGSGIGKAIGDRDQDRDGYKDVPTLTKKKHGMNQLASEGAAPSFLTEEVQRAMAEEEPPLLQQLRQGEWVTPDLLQVFQSNRIIAAGLRNPRCSAALQLMQQDPKVNRLSYHYGSLIWLAKYQGRAIIRYFSQ